MEPDAISVPAAAGGVERPVRAATGDSDFMPGIGAGLYLHGAGAELALVVCGEIDQRDHRVERVDSICVYYGRYAGSRARKEIRIVGGGVWSGICDWACGGGIAGTLQFAGTVLGGGRTEPGELFVWDFCAAGIVAAGEAGKVGVAHGGFAGVAGIVEGASGIGRAIGW